MKRRWLARGYQSLLACLLLATLSACATPDMTPFADGASSLASSIKQVNAGVGARFGSVADKTIASEDGRRIQSALAEYQRSSKIYDEMAGLAASYSTSVAALAAAGESGPEAAQQLVKSIQGFTKLAGLASVAVQLPADLTASTAGRVIQEAAQLWTRVQAHDRLLTTMEGANEAVQKLAEAFGQVYGEPEQKLVGNTVSQTHRPFEKIVRNLAQLERASLRSAVGANKLRFYESASSFLERQAYSGAAASLLNDSADDAAKRLSAVRQTLEERARVEPEVQAYYAANNAVLEWREQQLRVAYLISESAAAWAKEHERLLGWLKSCGGFRGLKGSCGQFSAATLQALAGEIQRVLKGDK